MQKIKSRLSCFSNITLLYKSRLLLAEWCQYLQRKMVVVMQNRLHYLPHHAVVRQDKTTSKIRVVYDVSAKTNGPSLNECLHVGPALHRKIFDILVRFRTYPITLVADIEKAFLMIKVAK